MNKAAMKAAIAKNSDTQERLAEALNMQMSGLSARINGKIDFRAGEISMIVKRYRLTPQETMDIFFDAVAS